MRYAVKCNARENPQQILASIPSKHLLLDLPHAVRDKLSDLLAKEKRRDGKPAQHTGHDGEDVHRLLVSEFLDRGDGGVAQAEGDEATTCAEQEEEGTSFAGELDYVRWSKG